MSNVPPPPPPGGGFPPPPPPGGGFPPPTPGGGGFESAPGAGFAGYSAPMGGARQMAGFGSRLGALIIDGLITALFFVPGYIALLAGPTKIDNCPDTSNFNTSDLCTVPTGGTWAMALLLYLIGFVATLVYWAKLEGSGQTVGQRTLGIRVVDENTGAQIGTGRAIGRYFARILSQLFCFLGYFWMLWDDKSQTWHDKIVHSVVVKEA